MSTTRLLVVINNFPPDLAGGAAVFGDMCHGLAERGFDVTVRCAYPYYPEWCDKSGRNGWRIWRYAEGDIKVERYGLYIPRNTNSLLGRLLHEASFLLSLLRSLPRGRQFDVVMAYCPAVSCLAFGVMNKFLWRKPLWLNVQDLAAEAAGASGLVRKRWLGRLLSAVQRWLFNRADVWSTISPVMAERLAPLRRRNQPLLVFPNWLNASLKGSILEARAEQQDNPKQLDTPLRLLYAGNIGKKQNLQAILEILHQSNASFEFCIHGSGAQAQTVQQWIIKKADSRFRFGPFLDEDGFAAALVNSHFFVISEHEESGASFMPSKLIPGISSATPILAICDADGPLGVEVEQHLLGLRLDWAQLGSLPAFISNLSSSQVQFRTWSENALLRAQYYQRDRIIDLFERELHSIASGMQAKTDFC